MPKTFRFKRTARAYQKVHGGRIVGTTGAYQVKRNAGRGSIRKTKKYQGMFPDTAQFLSTVKYHAKRRKAAKRARAKRPNVTLNVDQVGGWIKAKAVKFERKGRKLIAKIAR